MQKILSKLKEIAHIPILVLLICGLVLSGVAYAKMAAYQDVYNQLTSQMADNQREIMASLDGNDQYMQNVLARLSSIDGAQLALIDRLAEAEERILAAPRVVQYARAPEQKINEPDVPLAAAAAPVAVDTSVNTGDVVKVMVSASQVTDLYGYQFNLNYDESAFSYKGGLRSSIPEISTIFHNPFDGYLLVGATKMGSEAGYTGSNVAVCELNFEAKQDGAPLQFSLSEVNVVDSDMGYNENVPNWSCKAEKSK